MENVSSRCGKSDNAPRLRFPEFSGEWVEKKLREIIIEVKRKAEENSKAPVMMISATEGFINQSERYSSNNAGKSLKKYTLLKKGELAYNHGYSKTRNFGSCFTLEIEQARIPFVYHSFSLKGENDSVFWGKYLNSGLFDGKLRRLVASTARMDGLLNISFENYSSMPVNIPSLPEQKKIAAFFTLLDRRIQKQRQFVERLKTYKRGVSEAIFERKFGFPNKTNWKKIKIENLFSERCERAIGNEELLAVTINGGIQKRNEIQLKDNSSEDKSNYKRVHIGDIAYNTMRMWQGASGVSCYAGIVSPAYTVIVLKDKENQCIDFWGHYFKHTNLIRTFQKFSQGLTSDTWNLKYAQLSQINLYVPEYKEQCAIANFLHKFDSKISIEEKKLSQLSMLKNELLHRMFI